MSRWLLPLGRYVAVHRMRSVAPFSGRNVPVPDQLPANSANGPDCALAGGGITYNAESRTQQPKIPACDNGMRGPNVRKGYSPSSSC